MILIPISKSVKVKCLQMNVEVEIEDQHVVKVQLVAGTTYQMSINIRIMYASFELVTFRTKVESLNHLDKGACHTC